MHSPATEQPAGRKTRRPNSYRTDGVKTLDDIRARCAMVDDGCWAWRYSTINGKTPQVRYQGKATTTRRVALELSGRPVGRGMFVICKPGCHEQCVNPQHLKALDGVAYRLHLASIGVIENAAHQAARTASVRSRHTTKLTRNAAEDIRRRVASGEDRGALAVEFGVSRGHINRVAIGKNWSPAHDAPSSSVFAWCGSMGGAR